MVQYPEIIVSKPNKIILEFTTKCNLRCAYCRNAFPEYRATRKEIDELVLNNIIEYALDNNIEMVCVNGYGETTTYKNWHIYCNRMLQKGINLGIITNLAKTFSPEEIDCLSHFTTIEASCDTSDPELFALIRKGNTLDRFMNNMNAIRHCARSQGRPGPTFVWSCVITDLNIWDFCDYIYFGVMNGINIFNICNYILPAEFKNLVYPRRIVDLPYNKVLKAAFILKETQKRFSALNIHLNFNYGLIDEINKCIRNNQSDSNNFQEENGHNSPIMSIPEGMTRNCTQPWNFMAISKDGDVKPCCMGDTIGKIDESTTLHDIFNGEKMNILRESLLCGNLSKTCRECSIVYLSKIDSFRESMMREFSTTPA
jgi:radical SAM protein with 4Fe4S-binding SPASM domain